MIKDKLEECRHLRIMINDCNNKIKEIGNYKSPRFDNNSHSGSSISAAEQYLENVERYQDKKDRLISQLNSMWSELRIIFTESCLAAEEEKLLYLRFYKNIQWKKCAKLMFWSEGRTFGTFRKILAKCTINVN